jgi:hypothetical protein
MVIEFTLDNFEQLQEDLRAEQQRRAIQRRVLERAIDRLAEIGIITNTPYCKRLYIDGEREL